MSGLKRFKLLFINNDKGYLVLFEIYNRRNIIKRCFSDFLVFRGEYCILLKFFFYIRKYLQRIVEECQRMYCKKDIKYCKVVKIHKNTLQVFEKML